MIVQGVGWAPIVITTKSRVLEPVGEIWEWDISRGESSPIADDCPLASEVLRPAKRSDKDFSEQMKDVRWHLRGAIKSTSNIVDVILQAGQTSGRIVQCVPYLEHHVRPLSQQHDI